MYHMLLIHSSTKGYYGCFQRSAFVNNVPKNMNLQISFQDSALNSFGYIAVSGIARSYGNSIFNFLRIHYTIFIFHYFYYLLWPEKLTLIVALSVWCPTSKRLIFVLSVRSAAFVLTHLSFWCWWIFWSTETFSKVHCRNFTSSCLWNVKPIFKADV